MATVAFRTAAARADTTRTWSAITEGLWGDTTYDSRTLWSKFFHPARIPDAALLHVSDVRTCLDDDASWCRMDATWSTPIMTSSESAAALLGSPRVCPSAESAEATEPAASPARSRKARWTLARFRASVTSCVCAVATNDATDRSRS